MDIHCEWNHHMVAEAVGHRVEGVGRLPDMMIGVMAVVMVDMIEEVMTEVVMTAMVVEGGMVAVVEEADMMIVDVMIGVAMTETEGMDMMTEGEIEALPLKGSSRLL